MKKKQTIPERTENDPEDFNVGDVCSGIGCVTYAIKNLDHWKTKFFSQYDPEHNYKSGPDFPSAVLQQHYPHVPNLGDMTKLKTNKYFLDEKCRLDLLVGGTPCFTADTIVVTVGGLKTIDTVSTEDLVLTHTGKWQKVLKTGSKKAKIFVLKGHGSHGIRTTSNHPFYCRRQNKTWNNSIRMEEWLLDDRREWIDAKDSVGSFWAIPSSASELYIPKIKTIGRESKTHTVDEDLLWICGYYLGNGGIVHHKGITGAIKSSVLRLDANKLDKKLIISRIKKAGLSFCEVKSRTTWRCEIGSKPLCRWIETHFSKLAHNKTIPSWLIFIKDKNLLTSFVDGYFHADGNICYNNNKEQNGISFSTVSKNISIGMKMIASRLGYGFSEYKNTRPKKGMIEGRIINQRPCYELNFNHNSRTTKFDKKHSWQKIKKGTQTNEIQTVYNLEIEKDNSYIADGFVVHNCQGFSLAGLRGGMDDERSNLSLEYIRILILKKPGWFLWENVPGVLSTGKRKADEDATDEETIGAEGDDFANILSAFTGRTIASQDFPKAGVIQGDFYSIAYRILDSQYFGIPQRRRRIFVVGHLGNDWRPSLAVLFEQGSMRGDFTKGGKKGKSLADKIEAGTRGSSTFRRINFGQYQQDDISSAIQQRDYKSACDLIIQNPASVDVRNLTVNENISGTIQAGSHGHGYSNGNVNPVLIQNPVSFNVRAFTQNEDISGTIQAGHYKQGYSNGNINPVLYDIKQITSRNNKSNPKNGDPCYTITGSNGAPTLITKDILRRLTPVEVERLFSLPDNYTNIPWRGKPTSPDSLRYRACGNGMVTTVIEWICYRIDVVDKMLKQINKK